MEQSPINGHPPLQRLVIKMFGRKYELSPVDDLSVSASTVGEECQRQAPLYGYYATVRDMAETKVESLEALLTDKEAELDQHFRQTGMLPGSVKITEDGLKKAIKNDTDYKAIRDRIVEARGQAKQMGSIVRAFEQKKDMLVSMSTRLNNSTWNDRDVAVTVAAKVTKLSDELKGVGAHPSKSVM